MENRLNNLSKEELIECIKKQEQIIVKLTNKVLPKNYDLESRFKKAIEYMRSQYTITDDDLYLALYSSDGTLDKLENILRDEEDE